MNLQLRSKGGPRSGLLYYLGRAGGLLSKQTIDNLAARTLDQRVPVRRLLKTILCLGKCPTLKSSISKLCNCVRTRQSSSGTRQVYAMLRAGHKLRQEFRLPRSSCSLEARSGLPPRRGSSFSKASHVSRGKNWTCRPIAAQMAETLYAIGKAAALDGDAAAQKSLDKPAEY